MFGTSIGLSTVLVIFALIHFFKRGSGNWMWVMLILFLGPVGAVVYIIVEVVPEWRGANPAAGWSARRNRTRELEAAVYDNPSTGNYEELAELYRESGDFTRARAAFDKAITPRTDHPDPYYGRALCALALNDPKSAMADLEKVLGFDRKHDFFRAMGLLAYCCAATGDPVRAEQLYREALEISTLSETQYNFAEFLSSQGRIDEAREMVQRILNKRASLSGPLRREQEPWFKRADLLLRSLGSAPGAVR